MTSPSLTSKSAPRSAWTDPKFFSIPRSWIVGAVEFTDVGLSQWRRPRAGASTDCRRLLAVLLVDPGAHLALLQEPFLEEGLVVRLRDPDRGQQDRGRAADLAVDTGHRLALDDRDRGLGGSVRFLVDRLVDRSALPAGEDELRACRRRILAGQRDRLQAMGLERGDHGSREAVVGREDAADFVAVAGEHLIEDPPALDGIPVGVLVSGLRLLERPLAEQWIEDGVIALLEQLGIVVLDVPVQLGDDGMLRVRPFRLQRADEALALQLADLHVVERDVVRGLAPDDEAVVVDHLRAARDGEIRDRGSRARVELVEQDDLRALREAQLGLGLLLDRAAEGVDDRCGDACLLERRLQVRGVEQRVAGRRLRVRQQGAGLYRRLRACTCRGREERDCDAGAEGSGYQERPGVAPTWVMHELPSLCGLPTTVRRSCWVEQPGPHRRS